MNKAYVLIDYDNFVSPQLSTDELYSEITFLCSEATNLIRTQEDFDEINYRFYGGWYKESLFTQRASELASIVQNLDIFPIYDTTKRKRIYGSFELSTSLIGMPEVHFDNTLKEKLGVPRVRINKGLDTSVCSSNSLTCPVKIMNRFTANPKKTCTISGCSHLNNTVFVSPQQKMVDAMIACDLISLSNDSEISRLYLVSDDIDNIPPLILASRNSSLSLGIITKRPNVFDRFKNIFSDNRIEIIEWS